MPRRAKIVKREILPDGRYSSRTVTMFVNKLMERGKKSTAERIMYDAMNRVETQTHKSPIDTFEMAIRNSTPTIEVKPRRVGGATYQVPMEVGAVRRTTLAIRWILTAARERGGQSFSDKLAAELIDASNDTGAAIRKRDETHKMAEANRAFSHYRF